MVGPHAGIIFLTSIIVDLNNNNLKVGPHQKEWWVHMVVLRHFW